jgi:hypothetical protein
MDVQIVFVDGLHLGVFGFTWITIDRTKESCTHALKNTKSISMALYCSHNLSRWFFHSYPNCLSPFSESSGLSLRNDVEVGSRLRSHRSTASLHQSAARPFPVSVTPGRRSSTFTCSTNPHMVIVRQVHSAIGVWERRREAK